MSSGTAPATIYLGLDVHKESITIAVFKSPAVNYNAGLGQRTNYLPTSAAANAAVAWIACT